MVTDEESMVTSPTLMSELLCLAPRNFLSGTLNDWYPHLLLIFFTAFMKTVSSKSSRWE